MEPFTVMNVIIGCGIVGVLIRMNHHLGKAIQKLDHIKDISDDHEVRLRSDEKKTTNHSHRLNRIENTIYDKGN